MIVSLLPDAGVVDQDVGAAERLLGRGDQRRRSRRRWRRRRRPATVLTPCAFGDAPRLVLQAVRLARRHDDVDALFGERVGHRQPDADAAAGDYRDLVREDA